MNAHTKLRKVSVKYQANLKDNNLTDTGIPGAGPGGNPFYNIAWLAWEEAILSTSSSPIPNLMYFPELKGLQGEKASVKTFDCQQC
eukprot:1144733-Pelagomonas_calceolata.AAC.1